MQYLADSDIFLALVLSGHPRNPIVVKWFDALHPEDTVAFCRMTQNSFLRLLTTDAIMRPYTLTNHKAAAVYQSLFRDSRIDFAPEPAGINERWLSLAATKRAAPKLWMDAYLACFAELSHRRFVTLDQGFRDFAELDSLILTAA